MQLMFTRQVGDSGGGNVIAQSSRVSIMLCLCRVYLFAHSPSNESTCERDLLPLCSFGSERVYVLWLYQDSPPPPKGSVAVSIGQTR